MARPIWKGFITFGLVNIPVVLYPAERKPEVQFKLVDTRDNEPIRYMRINEQTGKEVPWEYIGKGYEYEENHYVIMQEEEIKHIAGENTKTINIEAFVNKDTISSMEYEKPYYLVPDKKGEKGYVILRETLKSTKKMGIAKVIIHTKEYLSALIPYQDGLVLNLIRYPSELKKLSEFDLPSVNVKDYKITPKELAIAKQLVQSMTSRWDPDAYRDEYQIALLKWAEEKINHKTPHTTMKQKARLAKTSNVVSFVDLLKQSIASKKLKSKTKASAHHKHAARKRKTPHKHSYA